MATRTIANGGGDWNVTGTWVEGVVPTNSDAVVATATSGNLVITANSSCLSADFTNYVGTVSGSGRWDVGSNGGGGTGGAFKLVAGMGWTYSGLLFFDAESTNSGAGWGITTAGKTFSGNITFGGTGGATAAKWTLQDSLTTTAQVILLRGELDTNSKSVSLSTLNVSAANVRTLTLGSSTITASASAGLTSTTTTNLTVTANTATLTCALATSTFDLNNVNWNGLTLVWTAAVSPSVISNSATVGSISVTFASSATGVSRFQQNTGNLTVTGNVTFTGQSVTDRALIRSDVSGTPRTLTCNGTVSTSYVDWQDMVGAGSFGWDLSAQTGGSGDAEGNSGITFTPSVTRYAVGTSLLSTSAWSTSSGGSSGATIPLPQDDAVFDVNSPAGTYNMSSNRPRAWRNTICTGFTRTLFFATAGLLIGNLTLGSAGTYSGVATLTGRSSGGTITGAGVGIAALTINSPGGTYTLQSQFTVTGTLTVTSGTFATGNNNLSCGTFSSSGSTTRAVSLGSSTVSLTATTGTPWTTATATGLTLSAASSTITVSTASASTRTFAGGGKTFGTLSYTVASSAGVLAITGANTFNTLSVSGGSRTLRLPSSTTTTVTNFNVNGTLGNLVTLDSSTAATAATLSVAAVTVAVSYLSIKDSTATGGASFTASFSTDVSGNTGWTISAGGVVTVSSTEQWSVRALASKANDVRWQVRFAITPKASDQRWQVRVALSKGSDQRWSVRALTSATLTPKWSVRTVLSKASDLRWQLRSTFAKTSDLRWSLRSLTTRALDSRWSLRSLSSTASDLRWRVRSAVTNAVTLQWQAVVLPTRISVALTEGTTIQVELSEGTSIEVELS